MGAWCSSRKEGWVNTPLWACSFVRLLSQKPSRSIEPAQKETVAAEEPAQTNPPKSSLWELVTWHQSSGRAPFPQTHPSLPFTSLQRQGIQTGTVQRCLFSFLLIFLLEISLWTGFTHAEWIEIKGNYGFCFALNGPCNPEICSWNLWLILHYCLSHLWSAIFHCFPKPVLVFSFNFTLKLSFSCALSAGHRGWELNYPSAWRGGGEWEVKIAQRNPLPTRDSTHLKKQRPTAETERTGNTFQGFSSDACATNRVPVLCYLCLPSQTVEGKAPENPFHWKGTEGWEGFPLNK